MFTTINNDKYRLSLFHNFIILVIVYDSVIGTDISKYSLR